MTKCAMKKMARDLDDALADALHEVRKAGKHLGGDAEDALARAATRVSESAHSLIEEARSRSTALTFSAARQVKAHSLASVGIATATAALIGLAFARSRSR